MYRFPVVVPTQFDLKAVYPTMQKYVDRILCDLPSHIEKVIIFGSAVTLRCGENSDLDILLITQKEQSEVLRELSPIYRGIGVDIDFVIKTPEAFLSSNIDEESTLIREIKEKGVTVYERTILTC